MGIRWASPALGEEEAGEVLACLRSGQVAMGPRVEAFEARVAATLGVTHAVAVSSGTAALDVALKGLGVGPGDEVVAPAFTYVATINAIVYQGATPVMVDVDADTLNLDPERVRAALGRRTRAIVAIDYGGGCADYDALEDVARAAGVPLLQDAAHSLGAAARGRRPGAFGVGATLSFHVAKVITSIEGGMLVTEDAALATTARTLRNQGEVPGRKYTFGLIGHNYRMSDVHAAIGLAQMGKLAHLLARRREVAAWYHEALAGLPGCTLPRERAGTTHAWFLYSIRLADARARERAAAALAAAQVETRICWPAPVYAQPAYAERVPPMRCPHAESAAARVLSLPLHADLSRDDVAFVARTLAAALRPAA